MSRHHGITSNSYKKFIVDSGAVYLDYDEVGETLLGATRGGNTFVIETDYRDMPVDGAKGRVKGGERITRVDATITANFVEISPTILALALPGSSTADYPDTPTKTHDQITRALVILLADYSTNVALLGEVTGDDTNAAVFIISNPLVTSNFEASLADADEPAISLSFSAHFDPSDMDTEPWEVRFPEIT